MILPNIYRLFSLLTHLKTAVVKKTDGRHFLPKGQSEVVNHILHPEDGDHQYIQRHGRSIGQLAGAKLHQSRRHSTVNLMNVKPSCYALMRR
jgi:hypothetical protein